MNPNQLKISFDADGTLVHNKNIQDFARELFQRGFEVHIVTRRFASADDYGALFCQVYGIKDIKKEHQELFVVAEHCSIPVENIHFMNMADKYEFFAQNEGFLWHLDDDNAECNDINRFTKTVAVSCSNGSSWRGKCERLIRKKLHEKI